jgi:hypothetical protein
LEGFEGYWVVAMGVGLSRGYASASAVVVAIAAAVGLGKADDCSVTAFILQIEADWSALGTSRMGNSDDPGAASKSHRRQNEHFNAKTTTLPDKKVYHPDTRWSMLKEMSFTTNGFAL